MLSGHKTNIKFLFNLHAALWKAFKQLKLVLASVAIWHPQIDQSLEQHGHQMAALASPRLDMCQTAEMTMSHYLGVT